MTFEGIYIRKNDGRRFKVVKMLEMQDSQLGWIDAVLYKPLFGDEVKYYVSRVYDFRFGFTKE